MQTAAAGEGRRPEPGRRVASVLRLSVFLAAWTTWLVVVAVFWAIMLLDGGAWFIAAAIGFTVFSFLGLVALSCCVAGGRADRQILSLSKDGDGAQFPEVDVHQAAGRAAECDAL